MRLLVLLLLVALVVLVVWALRRRAQERAGSDATDAGRYRVLETTSGSEAHVFIARATNDSSVLIGSVPITSEDFDERYAKLIFQAEDRVTTLNASRELHAEP